MAGWRPQYVGRSEHILQPLPVGLFAIHAPFRKGSRIPDARRPSGRRHAPGAGPALGFQPVTAEFPSCVRAPQLYRKTAVPLIDRVGSVVYDVYMNNQAGDKLAKAYRRLFSASPRESVL
jgi:hypothetical protein